MKVLVILAPDANLDKDTVNQMLNEEGYINTTPSGDGIAYYDCGKEPDWSWPDYTVVIGDCNIGRHHVDLSLPSDEEATSDLVDTLQTISESLEGDNAEGPSYE
jgi:hypothetical protein